MTDAGISSSVSVELQQPQYPVKCETDHVQLSIDSPDVTPQEQQQQQQQQQQPAGSDQLPSVSIASNVPSTIAIAVVSPQSLMLQDQNMYYQRCDAITAAAVAAAAGRNVTPVKCTSLAITLSSVFCCRAGSGYPSTVSPYRPFCSCLLECCIITVHSQIMKHLHSPSTSSPFTQHSSFKNPLQKIVMP